MISEHNLDLKKYSLAYKLKRVIINWCIFAALLIVFNIESIQRAMFDFANFVTVNWVYKFVNFIIIGFSWKGITLLMIPIVINTILIMMYRKKFDTVKIYSDGLEFIKDSKAEFIPYEYVRLKNFKNKGFKILCFKLDMRYERFLWIEF